jgi:hypothetical protein
MGYRGVHREPSGTIRRIFIVATEKGCNCKSGKMQECERKVLSVTYKRHGGPVLFSMLLIVLFWASQFYT